MTTSLPGGNVFVASGVTLGVNGVRFLAGDSLTVEECYIKSYSAAAIDFEPNSSAHLLVKNTSCLLANVGIFIAPAVGGTAIATISNSYVARNATGVKAQDNSRVTVFHSTVSDNSGDGIFANGLTGSGLIFMVDGSDVSGNGTGIHSNGSASTRVANSTITDNVPLGLSITASSAIISYQNNRLIQNGTNGVFSSVVTPND